MKVIYYNPAYLTASFTGAYLHACKNGEQVRPEKIYEITNQLDNTKPFIYYFGRGKNGEEVYLLNGKCSIKTLMKSVEDFLIASGKNPGKTIWVDPLPETPYLMSVAELLGIASLKNRAYYYYLPEIKRSVERARLQVKLHNTGV